MTFITTHFSLQGMVTLIGSLSKDDGHGKDKSRKKCFDWLNEEK